MTAVSRSKVFGAGLIALDLVTGPDPDAPIRSSTGGTCGNVLAILAYLGWDAYPVARLSDDAASNLICADMERWGVHLDWIKCTPTAHPPIIVQKIRRGEDGRSDYRFSWSCPHCGEWLPTFKAITLETVTSVKSALADAEVFFLDRLSRATLMLAAEASSRGALVVFEPSTKANEGYMREALTLAHVVKYANDRLASIPGAMEDGSATLLEVQTLGKKGLRYRHQFGRGISNWTHLPAVPAPEVADACGSGDWCSAGLIAKVGSGGQEGLRRAGACGVRAALQYGQALAAWNCGFEGARGGMYAIPRQTFNNQIESLVNGEFDRISRISVGRIGTRVVACPACPPLPEKITNPTVSDSDLRRSATVGKELTGTSFV